MNSASIELTLLGSVVNPGPFYSLVNSVDFHSKMNVFCVTYTHNNLVVIYKLDSLGNPETVQTLYNPPSSLSYPQHAAFSPDGTKLVVANWMNQTLAIYECDEKGHYFKAPIAQIKTPAARNNLRPHGIAFSPSGDFLAIAYGAASEHGRGIALFEVTHEGRCLNLVDLVRAQDGLPGIPKGIAFSPDGTCLLVTFSDVNCLVIYSKADRSILRVPKQVIQGPETCISRPEDVKISPCGNYCAVSNSDRNSVTFYPFDSFSNQITQSTPCDILEGLSFPHGMAFSPDGVYFLVTQFGEVQTSKDGGIAWNNATKPGQARVNIYEICGSRDIR